ncbi:MAG: hypothetical protein KDB23_05600, partial [Planctomycetales bacterium]|nr:hypothetical protein [Planctomycetales bacterium]
MSDFDPRPSHAIPARDGNYLPATVSPANVPMGMPMSAAPWMDSSEPKSGFNIISFLHSLRRRWLMGLGLGFLVSSIIAALLWLLVPVKYEALAQLRIHRNPPELLRDKFARPQLPQDFEITKQTQAALIRSPRVLEAALREPGIAQLPLVRDEPWFGERDNPVAWLDRQLKIEFAPNSELLQISMKERRPDDLKKVLEAVIKSYDTEIVKREQMERNDRFTKLKNRHRELQTEVSTQWSEFGELAKTYGSQESEAVKTKIEIETRQLSDVARQRQQVEQQLFEAQADYMMLQHRLLASQSTQPDNWQLEEALNMYPEYRLFNEQKIQLEQAISFSQPQGGAGRSMGGGQLQQLQTQLATVNQKMEEFRYSHRNEAVQRVKQADNTDERKIQQEFSAKQQILRMLEQRRAALDAEQKRLADTLLAANRFSADMMVRQNQLKSDEDTLDSIKQELERLQLEMDNATQVDIITHATIPDESNWIAKYMQIIAAWGL